MHINLRKDPKTDTAGHNFVQRVIIRFSESNLGFALTSGLAPSNQYKTDRSIPQTQFNYSLDDDSHVNSHDHFI